MLLHKCRTIIRLATLSSALFLSCSTPISGNSSLRDGIGIVTTSEGAASIISAATERSSKLGLHGVLSLTNHVITTVPDSRCAIALSNEVAFSMGSEAQVQVFGYSQRSFEQSKESFDRKVTVSKLMLVPDEGTIGIAANRLPPLSKVSIKTEHRHVTKNALLGELQDHDGRLRLPAFDVHMTLTHSDETRGFIAAPNGPNVGPNSTILARHTSRLLKDGEKETVIAAETSSKRVIFRAGETADISSRASARLSARLSARRIAIIATSLQLPQIIR